MFTLKELNNNVAQMIYPIFTIKSFVIRQSSSIFKPINSKHISICINKEI